MQRSVRSTNVFPTTTIHHVRPVTVHSVVKMPSHTHTPHAPWLWRIMVGFVRRPMLALTLGIVVILLFSTVSEAAAAARLTHQVQAAQQSNFQVQLQLTQTAAQIQLHTAPAAIVAAAERLGWVVVTPQPTSQP